MKSLFDFKTSKHPELKGNATIIKKEVVSFLDHCLDIIYPGNVKKIFQFEKDLQNYQTENSLKLENIFKTLALEDERIKLIVESFKEALCSIAQLVYSDAEAICQGDPAATSLKEVVLTYPGLEAIAGHRIANFFYESQIPILPRALSEVTHGRTGIDIHPGAKIGKSFFIDHGTGVVIGETAIIGQNVKIYQGVTLGALSVDKSLAKKKRHPTIEDNCVIYSHATILGGETVIGNGSIIGGNVWITKSIPPNSMVYHKSEVRLNRNTSNITDEELNYEI
ncbi:MAG: serine O-acetyltransferase EpsC [Bacteriovorax sp.]|nr:serine O-acetyltransferase EpsC [Bacteriovorax sp.]